MKKSSSNHNLKNKLTESQNLYYDRPIPSGSTKGGDYNGLPQSLFSSRRGSFDEGTPRFDEGTKSLTDYDIDYIEELELNKAFNLFKDV